jgi:serine phosphatase RsbU (regulator of sigma subunit)
VFEREHRIAETLQRNLLPERLPELPGLEVAARYLPAAAGADVGGDWYDCVPLSDDSVALVMGDVVGRGVTAAALVGKLRNALLAYALDGHPAPEVAARLNRFMFEAGERPMATLLYAVYRPRAHTVEIVSAGHPPPLTRRAGTVSELKVVPSVPLGAFSDTRFESVTVPLERGSMLVLYTDGLVDRRRVPIDEGIGVLASVLAATNGSADRACEDVVARLVGDGGGRRRRGADPPGSRGGARSDDAEIASTCRVARRDAPRASAMVLRPRGEQRDRRRCPFDQRRGGEQCG